MTEKDQISLTAAGGVEVSQAIAGVGGRSYAFIIDWHIRLLIVAVWLAIAFVVVGGDFSTTSFDSLVNDQQINWMFYIILLPPFLIYILYHPILEVVMGGRTPGKRIAGVKIVAKSGLNASVGALIIRNVFRIIDSLPAYYILGLSVAIINKQNCRIGDLAAGTILVYEEKFITPDINWLNKPGNSSLSPQHHELVVEILERWQILDRETRIRLAKALLTKIGIEIPSGLSPKELDGSLKNKLKQLIHND